MGETTGLEQMICFNLYAASRAMTALYRPALDAHGITYPQYVALRVIWHRGDITVRDLGHALALDSGTLSPLLKRLETQGLITRRRGTDDERTVWISPTDRGRELHHEVSDLPERLACAVDLSTDEFRQLHHLLSRVRDSAASHTI
ncbi:MarR family winged helix-turn-helix transcriptional regulator [Krasilnikovia sp. MM14-A1004]|uniref:MarR family winged helix-turn-helix transcriptional regulator n=1 Tax=Krasilnikovia sp. MM14-A1004 TaxID=3373541 RepID=UPI00399CC6A5